MESPSKVFTRAARVDGPLDYGPQVLTDWHPAQGVDVSLLTMRTPRLNLLLIGRDAGVSKVLETILADLDDPVTTWFPGQGLVLPPKARSGTLILHEVGALAYADQCRLGDWMERARGRTQVVSTSERALLPRVEAGMFIDTLYYRLNTICLDVI
jgi:hypothetical protein